MHYLYTRLAATASNPPTHPPTPNKNIQGYKYRDIYIHIHIHIARCIYKTYILD